VFQAIHRSNKHPTIQTPGSRVLLQAI